MKRLREALWGDSALERSPEIARALRGAPLGSDIIGAFAHGIGVKDASGRLLVVNEALCELSGRAPDALLGIALIDLVSPTDRALVRDQLRQRRRLQSCPYDTRILRPDGREALVMVIPHALQDGGLHVGSVVVVSEMARVAPSRWLQVVTKTPLPRPAPQLGDNLYASLGGSSGSTAGDSERREAAPSRSSLSPREHQVLGLFARGFQPPSIATRLGISVNTARNHLKNVCAKLGVGSLSALREYFASSGE